MFKNIHKWMFYFLPNFFSFFQFHWRVILQWMYQFRYSYLPKTYHTYLVFGWEYYLNYLVIKIILRRVEMFVCNKNLDDYMLLWRIFFGSYIVIL